MKHSRITRNPVDTPCDLMTFTTGILFRLRTYSYAMLNPAIWCI